MDEWGIDASPPQQHQRPAMPQERGARLPHLPPRRALAARRLRTRASACGCYDRIDERRAAAKCSGAWSSTRQALGPRRSFNQRRRASGCACALARASTSSTQGASPTTPSPRRPWTGGRVFICPQQNTTLLGTTDDDYYGDLDQDPRSWRMRSPTCCRGCARSFRAIDRLSPDDGHDRRVSPHHLRLRPLRGRLEPRAPVL
jgi:hypothetical protein